MNGNPYFYGSLLGARILASPYPFKPVPTSLSDKLPIPVADDVPLNGPPTKEQLRKINALVPSGFEPLVAEEVFVVTGAIADNFLNRSFGRWSAEALQDMAKLIINCPATLNHDWDDVEEVWGRTFEATTITMPYDQVPKLVLDRAGNLTENRKIAKAEGWVRCIASAFTSIDNPILASLRYVQASEISTGGFDFSSVQCPLCNSEFGEGSCNHYPPSPWLGRNEADPREAPYYIRGSLFDMLEWSIVCCPNIPNAGVI